MQPNKPEEILPEWKAHPIYMDAEGTTNQVYAVKVVRRYVSVIEETYYVPYQPGALQGKTCSDLEKEAESQVKLGRIPAYRRSESDHDVTVTLDCDKFDLYTKYIKYTMDNHATLGTITLHWPNDDCGSEEPCEPYRNDG